MATKKSYFRDKCFLAGIFFLALQIIVIIRNYFADYIYFFWFCDFAPLLLALAFFLRKEHLAKAVINFGLIFQIGFILLYIQRLFSGKLADELIFSSFFNSVYFSATLFFHLSTAFALLMTYRTKPTIKTINYSIALILAIYFVSLFFTPSDANINHVYLPWGLIKFSIPYYTYLWPSFAFIFLVLPTQSFQYFLYKLSVRKNNGARD